MLCHFGHRSVHSNVLLNPQYQKVTPSQAMAAYRTAARLFPGLHVPLLGMGMEYQRMNNLHLAEQMFYQACSSLKVSMVAFVLIEGI